MKWTKQIATLGPNIVRVACVPEGQKSVNPTFALRVPERFRRARTSSDAKGRMVFKNSKFTILLLDDSKPFTSRNLHVEWTCGGKRKTWRPGRLDRENLGGNYYALDLFQEKLLPRGVRAFDPMEGPDAYANSPARPIYYLIECIARHMGRHPTDDEWRIDLRNFLEGKPPQILDRWPRDLKKRFADNAKYPPGYLSRSGATIFRDSSLPWDPERDWIHPIRSAEEGQQVIYLVHYGDNFKKGVCLLTELLGTVPAVPDWVLGVWFSCYRVMGEKEYVQIRQDFEKHDLPLDVVVVDTDWHRAFWHGFDWNSKLFPDPKRFARFLKRHKLHAVFNVHPEYIPKGDSGLPEFFRRTGVAEWYTNEETTPHPFHVNCIPIDMMDRDQAVAYLDVFHPKVEKTGCDIWWIDAPLREQFGPGYVTFLNELYYLNTQKDCADFPRVVLSRAYGLGAHRSAIAFTGDTLSQWAVLEQEVVLTQKAANCLLAYTSHDVGGFYPGDWDWRINKPDDDLFIRWCQFGCLSPIFRLHSDHGVREPWKFRKKTLGIVRRYMQFRKCLAPYFLELVREAQRTGVAPCRPMYFEFPQRPESFQHEKQYMLGPGILVAPVTNREGQGTIWFPPGTWVHWATGRRVAGPARVRERIAIDDMPVYVREGSTIPYKTLETLKEKGEVLQKGKSRRYKGKGKPLAERMGLDLQ